MRHPDLAGINLNALLTLDSILATRSVGLAAQQLGLTKSAVSHTLRYLRDVIGDPLLVRTGNAMKPTPRGEALMAPLRRGLLELESAMRRPVEFDPVTSERRIRLAARDAMAASPLPQLLSQLDAQAPRMSFELAPLESTAIHAELEAGALDLALLPGEVERAGLQSQRLFCTRFVVVAWAEHPDLGATLGLDQYCALPHALVTTGTGGKGLVDVHLERLGRARRVAVRFPYFLAAPWVLVGTRLLMTCPRVAAESFAGDFPLRLLEPPLPLPEGSISMVWHERFELDPALAWFRNLLLDVCASAFGPPST